MKVLWRTLHYLKPYWTWQLLALGCSVLTTVLGLAFPWIMRILIDQVFVAQGREMGQMVASLKWVCLAFLGISLLTPVVDLLRSYLFANIGERAVIDLRRALFEQMERLPLAHFNQERTGRLMSIFTNDVGVMQQMYTSTLVDFITNGLRMAITFVVLFKIDVSLASIALPTLFLFGLNIKLFAPPLRRIGTQVQEKNAAISENLQESIVGVREVKSFTQEGVQLTRFLEVAWDLWRARIRQSLWGSSSGVMSHLIGASGVILILWLGGNQVIHGDLTAGTLIAFTQYLMQLFGPTAWFVNLNVTMQGALAGADRVFAFLDLEPAIRDAPEAMDLAEVRGRVAFQGVRFSYDGEDGPQVLRDITFTAEPGQTIALVGPSGAGKSTLMNLIPRFYEPQEGTITVDSQDLRKVTQRSLRRQIGQVFQDPFLFSTTIRENIRFGRPEATDEEVEVAARAANAHEFIRRFPQGYETSVGERGVKLSGGQLQRIAIARAILRDPKILLLDEATSSLDSASEAAVQEALERLMQGRTSFVIAHRLSTILKADCILVLDHGRIVEAGTHAELLARGGVYQQLYRAQFAGRE